ncbi:hypothetical protein D3C75_1290380 [compost metagenome]
MAEEQQEPTAEAVKQRRKREKEAVKNAALDIEKFTVEVAGVFKPDLIRRYDHDPTCESSSSMIRSAFFAAVVANS